MRFIISPNIKIKRNLNFLCHDDCRYFKLPVLRLPITFGYCRRRGFFAQNLNRNPKGEILLKSSIEFLQPRFWQYLVMPSPFFYGNLFVSYSLNL